MPKKPNPNEAKIIALYESGVAPSLIAERFNLHIKTVRNMIRRIKQKERLG